MKRLKMLGARSVGVCVCVYVCMYVYVCMRGGRRGRVQIDRWLCVGGKVHSHPLSHAHTHTHIHTHTQGKPTLIYRCDLEEAVKEAGLAGKTEGEILGIYTCVFVCVVCVSICTKA
jgi:hypothetical protein